jgi:hypothetical protein
VEKKEARPVVGLTSGVLEPGGINIPTEQTW